MFYQIMLAIKLCKLNVCFKAFGHAKSYKKVIKNIMVEMLPENLRKSMGGHWELTQKNRKALEERNK